MLFPVYKENRWLIRIHLNNEPKTSISGGPLGEEYSQLWVLTTLEQPCEDKLRNTDWTERLLYAKFTSVERRFWWWLAPWWHESFDLSDLVGIDSLFIYIYNHPNRWIEFVLWGVLKIPKQTIIFKYHFKQIWKSRITPRTSRLNPSRKRCPTFQLHTKRICLTICISTEGCSCRCFSQI